MLALLAVTGAPARELYSIAAVPGAELAKGPGGCTVELLRRTSHHHLCVPAELTVLSRAEPDHEAYVKAGGNKYPNMVGYFGCKSADEVWTSEFCAGLFYCSNGRSVVCGGMAEVNVANHTMSCTCTSTCEQDNYIRDIKFAGKCP